MSDINRLIEPFFVTQGFGVNPENYAKFGLKGHNGIDIRTKYSDTPDGKRVIKAPYFCKFYRKGDEGSNGYGKFFEIIVQLKSTWKLTQAHCDKIFDFATRDENEEMAISDNTGNSTGSHLHLTVKKIKIKSDGTHEVIDYNNGYFGAVDPQLFFDELRDIKSAQNESPDPNNEKLPKRSVVFDFLISACGSTSDNEINAYMQSNKNLQEIFVDVFKGNGRFYDLWIKPHVNTKPDTIPMPVENEPVPEMVTSTTPEIPTPQNGLGEVLDLQIIKSAVLRFTAWVKSLFG